MATVACKPRTPCGRNERQFSAYFQRNTKRRCRVSVSIAPALPRQSSRRHRAQIVSQGLRTIQLDGQLRCYNSPFYTGLLPALGILLGQFGKLDVTVGIGTTWTSRMGFCAG